MREKLLKLLRAIWEWRLVRVEVVGGVAHVTKCPPWIRVEKFDYDVLECGECPDCGRIWED